MRKEKMKILLFFTFCLLSFSMLQANIFIVNKPSALPSDPKQMYIDLIKKSVSNTIYQDASYHGQFSIERRTNGQDWPLVAHTMIGLKRLNNIHYCLEQIIENNIPGDCIETGVWRGGATILMRAILKAHGIEDRRVWVADSFEGLPPPSPLFPVDAGSNLHQIKVLAVSLEEVQANFAKYGLLDEKVIFVKGFFAQTLPTIPINEIALLRLDGDLYQSTMEALVYLYPKLSVGGYVIIDDYQIVPYCKRAVDDYRQMMGIKEPMIAIDSDGVFWQKTE